MYYNVYLLTILLLIYIMLSISENFRYYKLRAHASQCAKLINFVLI